MSNGSSGLPVAVVLGGTFPHIRLIENLKKRGYYTILVDYYEHPPAKSAADEHIQESTLDLDKTVEIAREREAKLVITTCIDQANVTACYVAEKLGLPSPYSYETSLAVTNKGLMKDCMVQNGIPTSRYIFVKDLSGFESSGLSFPVVVKPADSNSSKGVRKACDLSELSRFLDEALKVSRTDDAIIEEYREGREIGVDFVIRNRKASIVMTRERRKVVSGGDPIQQIQGSVWPADITECSAAILQKIAEDIADAFGLDNTPLMIQAILNGRKMDIIEFAPRIGGAESYRIIDLHTGVDIIDCAIDSFLGTQFDVQCGDSGLCYADAYLYARAGVFGQIVGYDNVVNSGAVLYANTYKRRGTEIGPDLASSNRIGAFLVSARERSALHGKVMEVIDSIDIHDIDGKPMMRRELYGP